jgi:hypothetical protein
MKSRAERVVYVIVDSELSYGQFAAFVDRIEGATDDLHVIVISGEIRREFTKDRIPVAPLNPSNFMENPISVCDLVYPTDEFTVEHTNR